jgi:hypothetical protein
MKSTPPLQQPPSAASRRLSSSGLPRSGSDVTTPDTSIECGTPPPCPPDSSGSSGRAAVRVFVRIRPFSEQEKSSSTGASGPPATVHCDAADPQLITILDPKNEFRSRETYAFERTFWSVAPTATNCSAVHIATQQDVFQYVGMPVLTNVLNGYNGCIFAYGQTGSGKTYTMMGLSEENPSVASPLVTLQNASHRPSTAAAQGPSSGFGAARPSLGGSSAASARLSSRPEDQGVIPRLSAAIFLALKEKHELDKSHSFRIEVAYYEIYNEKVFDLLAGASPAETSAGHGELRVRLDPVNGPFVEGLTAHAVVDESAISRLLRKGTCARHVAATKMNDRSSRSHAIFSLHITQMWLDDRNETLRTTSKLNLVDLAGSERTGQAGVDGIHFKESTRINLSLTTLGRVIDHLAESGHVGVPPYRESQLTWLLMDSLGGNSKTTMVATISPSLACYEEMLQTLRYASRAKQIVNKVVVNEDPQARRLKELEALVLSLRTVIDQGGTNTYSNDYVEDLTARLHESQRVVGELKSTVASLRCDVEQLQQAKKQLETELIHEKENTVRAQQLGAVAQVVKSRSAVPVLTGSGSRHSALATRNASPTKNATAVSTSGRGSASAKASTTLHKQPSLTTTPRTTTNSSCTSPRSGAPTPTPRPEDGGISAALVPCPSLKVSSSSRFERTEVPPRHVLGEMSTERLLDVVDQLKRELAAARSESEELTSITNKARASEQCTVNEATKRILALSTKSNELSKVIQSHEVQHADYIKLIDSLAADVEQGNASVAAANKKVASLLEAQSKQAKEQTAAREAKDRELLAETLKAILQDAKKCTAATLAGVEREVATRVRCEMKIQHDKAMQAAEMSWEAKIAQIRKSLSEQLAEERGKVEQELSSSRTKAEALQSHEFSLVKSQLAQLQHQHSALAKARTADLAEAERLRVAHDEEKRTTLADQEKRLLSLRRELDRSATGRIQAAEEATRDMEALMKKKELDHFESQKALRSCLEHDKERAVAEATAQHRAALDRRTEENKQLTSAIAQRDDVIAELQRKVESWETTAKQQEDTLLEVRGKVAAAMSQVAADDAAHGAEVARLTDAHGLLVSELEGHHRAELERVKRDLNASHAALLREVEATHESAMRNATERQSRLEEEMQCLQELLQVDAVELAALQSSKAELALDNSAAAILFRESDARRKLAQDHHDATTLLLHEIHSARRLVELVETAWSSAETQQSVITGEEMAGRSAIVMHRVVEDTLLQMLRAHSQNAAAMTQATEASTKAAMELLRSIQMKETAREKEAAMAGLDRRAQFAAALARFTEQEERINVLQTSQLETFATAANQTHLALLQLGAQSASTIQSTAEKHLSSHEQLFLQIENAMNSLTSECRLRMHELSVLHLSSREAALRGNIEEEFHSSLVQIESQQDLAFAEVRSHFVATAVEEHFAFLMESSHEVLFEYSKFARAADLFVAQESGALQHSSMSEQMEALERELHDLRESAVTLRNDRAELTLKLRDAADAHKRLEILLDEANLKSIERDLGGSSSDASVSGIAAKKTSNSRIGGFLNLFGGQKSSAALPSASSAGPVSLA